MEKIKVSEAKKALLESMKGNTWSPQEELEQEVFDAVESLMIEKIKFRGRQTKKKNLLLKTASLLEQINRASKRLSRTKYFLTERTILEMIEYVAYEGKLGADEFLPRVASEYLDGTAKEKKAIIDQVDLSELTDDTFALITKYLKSKEHLKKKKGFGV